MGTAKDKVRGVDPEKLNSDTGVKHLTELLDEVFLKDQSTRAYCAFKDFVDYRRKSGDDFTAFIVQFEKLYHEVKTHKMELPTGALAFFLLQAANLPDESERLARVTSLMEYDNMKSQIHKIFGENHAVGNTMPIKLEECNYTKRGGRFNGNRFQRGAQRRYDKPAHRGRRNPVDKDGTQLTCHICKSEMHFADSCPHRILKAEANTVKDVEDALIKKLL